jgi:hypothetical protein
MGTMIRHAGIGLPQSIAALAHPMCPSACFRPLVAAPGRTELLPTGFPSAHWTAIALPTVAMAADAEDGPTGTTVARSQNNLRHDYPSSPITLHQMIDDARLRPG